MEILAIAEQEKRKPQEYEVKQHEALMTQKSHTDYPNSSQNFPSVYTLGNSWGYSLNPMQKA